MTTAKAIHKYNRLNYCEAVRTWHQIA